MKARDFAPIRPLSNPPSAEDVPVAECLEVLLDSLRGVTLGTHDLRTLRWLANLSAVDVAKVRTIVSLIERVRRAGQIAALEAVNEHLVAAGHHASAEIARGRAHDIRVGRWLLDDRAGDRR